MPNVGGKKFPYTAAGRAAADRYRKRMKNVGSSPARGARPGAARPGVSPRRRPAKAGVASRRRRPAARRGAARSTARRGRGGY
jgi:hypothetical protein